MHKVADALTAMLRRWRRAAAAGLAFVSASCVVAAWVYSLGPAPIGEGLEFSTVVVDREGRLLRPYATTEGRWRLPVTLDAVDPRYVSALIAYEDKRFRSHKGVDPLALGRAAWQFVSSGRIVSGGSTLTMQVARLLEPRAERTFAAKVRQTVRALQLERTFSKDEIITLYLNLAPYGGNLEGVRAGALAYFGKEPRRLSLAETAMLVALPQSPEARRPDRAQSAARKARDRVLHRIAAAGFIAEDEAAQAMNEPAPLGRRPMPALAPHASDAAVAFAPGRKRHVLTIEAPLQRSLEEVARERARKMGPDVSIAIVVLDNASGEVLARVASADYFDERRAGQVDMSQALRSPGSALKPFIYGLGFEDGVIHPETLVEDRPVRYGSYAPENFDLTFQGTVSIRKALQMSLNVPAVAVLESVRASRLTSRLGQAGGVLTLPQGEAPGLAMGLGGVGVRLTDLTMLYAGLARLGTTVPVVERVGAGAQPPALRLMDQIAAWHVGDILMGTPPPENAARGRIAFKTGTSYGYRDAWSVGFDGKRTIGVWVGRADGAPVPGLLGRTAAAPILFEAFARSGRSAAPLVPAPRGTLIASNPRLPPPLRNFPHGRSRNASGDPPLQIVFPPDGARLDFTQQGSGRSDPVALKISGGTGPWTMLVNGIPQAAPSPHQTLFWSPDGPGFVRFTVTDARGNAESVVVRLE